MEASESRKRPAQDDPATESPSQAKRPRVTGTCDWILDDTVFQIWRDSTSSTQPILWVNGPVGSGKTFLAQHVAEILQQSTTDWPTICCLCEATTSPQMMVESIMGQLTLESKLSQASRDLASNAMRDLQAASEAAPYTPHASWDLLESVLADMEPCTLIVDGLDELGDELLDDDGFDIGKRLEKLVASQAGRLKLYLSSRTVSSIKITFDTYLQIVLTSEKTEDDMRRFCTYEIQQYPDLLLYQTMIVDNMTLKAEGNFRWASMAIRSLDAAGVTESEETLIASLKRLPLELNDLYEALVTRIFDNESPIDAQIRTTTLCWVLNCVRPLTLTELAVVVSVSDNIMILETADRIIKACGSLIKIENELVKPTHYSLREYVRSTDTGLVDVSNLHGPQAHGLIASTCLRYFHHRAFTRDVYSDIDTSTLQVNYPLLEYATLYWVHHFCKADVFQQGLEDQLTDFFGTYNAFIWVDQFLAAFLSHSVLEIPPRPMNSVRIAYLFQMRSQIVSAFTEYPNRREAIDQSTANSLLNLYQRAATSIPSTPPNDILSIRRTLDIGEVYGWLPGHRSESESTITTAFNQVNTLNLTNSPDPATRLFGLSVHQAQADSLKRGGKYNEAKPLLENLLTLYSQHPPPVPRTLETNRLFTLDALGWTYTRLNQLDQAAEHLNSAVTLASRIHGSTSPAVLRSKTTLAETLARLDRADEALALCADLITALDNHREFDDELPPDYVSSLNVLAGVYVVQGRLREAVETYEVLVERRGDGYGIDHPMTVWAKMQLGLAKEKMVDVATTDGDDVEEEKKNLVEFFEALVRTQERVLGEAHPDVRTSRDAITRLRGDGAGDA